MTRKTKSKVMQLVKEDKDLLRGLVHEALQEMLEAEMEELIPDNSRETAFLERKTRVSC